MIRMQNDLTGSKSSLDSEKIKGKFQELYLETSFKELKIM